MSDSAAVSVDPNVLVTPSGVQLVGRPRAIYAAVIQSEARGLSVSEIAREIQSAPTNITAHVKRMVAAGVLEELPPVHVFGRRGAPARRYRMVLAGD